MAGSWYSASQGWPTGMGGGPAYESGSAYGAGGWQSDIGDLGQGYIDDPYGLWQAAMAGQMSDAHLRNPRLLANRGVGFDPTYGDFMMQGLGSWSDYLENPPGAGNPTGMSSYVDPRRQFRTAPSQSIWERAMEASKNLGVANPTWASIPGGIPGKEVIGIQGFLQGPNARRNTIAMGLAGMGGGIGVGGAARKRAIANLYDIYAARAGATGSHPGGFLNWFGNQYTPTYGGVAP